MSHIHGILKLSFIVLAALVLALCSPTFARGSITFGTISIIDDVTDHYQITGIKVDRQSVIYRSFKNKDEPTGNFTKKTILAQYDAIQSKYDWMMEIDTGNVHFVPIFLPGCDQKGVIVVFPNCTNDFPLFHRRTSGDESPFVLIIKVDKFGSVLWSKVLNSPLLNSVVVTEARSCCDPAENEDIIYLAGSINQTIPFGCARVNPSPGANSFISQFDYSGSCVWASAISNATITSVKCRSDLVYVAGRQDIGHAGFGSIPSIVPDPSLFVASLRTNNGTFSQLGTTAYSNDAIPIGISLSDAEYFGSLHISIVSSPVARSLERYDFNKTNLIFNSHRAVLFDMESGIPRIAYGMNESIYLTGSLQSFGQNSESTAYVAKLNKIDSSYAVIMVYNNFATNGLEVSIGKDGYVSVLGRSESPLAFIFPSNRNLSSNSTFNFIAEVMDLPPITCFEFDSSNSSVCSGRGSCVENNTCTCNEGYTGFNCQYTLCDGISSNDRTVCRQRGSCGLNDTCFCNLGYLGKYCEQSNATLWFESNAIEGLLFENNWALNVTIAFSGNLLVTANVNWAVRDLNSTDERTYSSVYTLHSPIQSIQNIFADLARNHQYTASVSIQIATTTNIISSKVLSMLIPKTPQMNVAVVPNSGAMLYDHFLLNSNISYPGDVLFSFGYINRSNNRVFLVSNTRNPTLNTTLSVLGNVTLFAQALFQNGETSESTTIVTVYQGESSKVTNALTEKANDLSHRNGTEFESLLTTYTNSLVTSIQALTSNQTSQLLNNLINIIQSKGDELSTTIQIGTIKTISQQFNYLSEVSTIQTSLILINSIQRNDSKIIDSIDVAHNLANVMISTNSSNVQRESFSSMVVVLTDKVRKNMTEGQTQEISFPNLETVISKLNSTSIGTNTTTTILVRHPSSSNTNTNTGYVQIVLNRDTLANGNVSFVQGQAIANPPDQYSNKCNTSGVSPTVSTKLFTENQQLIQSVDSPTLTQSSLSLPSLASSLRNHTKDYQYACKYLNTNNKQWLQDAKVCRTQTTSKNSNDTLVQCICSQPVSHTVSLDYIQSSESVITESGDICSNPCGCSIQRRNQGLKTYAIVLIVLACFTVVVIITLLAVGTAAIIFFKLLSTNKSKFEPKKQVRAPTDEIEQRFDSMYN